MKENLKISVVIRSKNQVKELDFLLMNLKTRYTDQISEIIVLDNNSVDSTQECVIDHGFRYENIDVFSYGGSANLLAEKASNSIVVILSAHAYPVSHDFFTVIQEKFSMNENLAGLRCLHNPNDYRNYINKVPATVDPNKSGLIFCGSAFNKNIWKQHKFKSDITTFEDKEWTLRVLKAGYDIDFAPAIFSYQKTRTKEEEYFRFKNELVGSFKLWHEDVNLIKAFKALMGSLFHLTKRYFIDLFYTLKRFIFTIRFALNKPEKHTR